MLFVGTLTENLHRSKDYICCVLGIVGPTNYKLQNCSYEDNFFDVLNTKYCYSNCSGQYYVLLHTSLLLFIVIIIVAFKTVRMMADSIMEGQDAFIMRKSDSEDVGFGGNYKDVLEDIGRNADLYIANQENVDAF